MASDVAREIISLFDRPSKLCLLIENEIRREIIVTSPIEKGILLLRIEIRGCGNSIMVEYNAKENLDGAAMCIAMNMKQLIEENGDEHTYMYLNVWDAVRKERGQLIGRLDIDHSDEKTVKGLEKEIERALKSLLTI